MTKNMIKPLILFAGILMSATVLAQEEKDSAYIYQGNLGLSVGTDIGGAVPFPVSNIPGTINAYPQINPALGASISFSLVKGWGVGVEINYKTVAMRADARVSNQRFNMDNATMYFTGTTKTEMKFIILEVPVYAKYRFDNRNFAFAGAYY
ncbi:MAG: PorT family protein, partial [Prevotellaceae bacterium]|nr:PorT family protein [Prevotellaceae bacterium]